MCRSETLAQRIHLVAELLLGYLGVNLCATDAFVPQQFAYHFYGHIVGQADDRCHRMAGSMPGDVLLYSTFLYYRAQHLVAGSQRGHVEDLFSFRARRLSLHDLQGYRQQFDVDLRTRLLPVGMYPQLVVNGIAHDVVFTQPAQVNMRQPRVTAEDEEITDERPFMVFAERVRCQPIQLFLGEETSVGILLPLLF